jgi:hypothetical protein
VQGYLITQILLPSQAWGAPEMFAWWQCHVVCHLCDQVVCLSHCHTHQVRTWSSHQKPVLRYSSRGESARIPDNLDFPFLASLAVPRGLSLCVTLVCHICDGYTSQFICHCLLTITPWFKSWECEVTSWPMLCHSLKAESVRIPDSHLGRWYCLVTHCHNLQLAEICATPWLHHSSNVS